MALNKKAAFYTLGCKVNQYETESIKKQFLDRGYLETEFDSAADVYVINSCTVTNLADRKTRNMLRRAKSLNPESIVVATGCYAQTNAEDIAKISEVDYIIGNSDKIKIAEIVDTKKSEKISVGNIFEENRYQEYEFTTLREMSRAYIKIQDGCDNFCSYCKIPFARGKKRSRNPENILQEVKKLVQEGYKEVILIGINLGAYGEEFEKKITLENIVRRRLPNIDIDFVDDKRIIKANDLNIVHGHEFASSIMSPVNIARGLYLRAKSNAVCGHHHRSSEHTEMNIEGKIVTTWSVGCLSELHPQYMPINSWNHGFLIVELHQNKKEFTVHNKRIFKGKVL